MCFPVLFARCINPATSIVALSFIRKAATNLSSPFLPGRLKHSTRINDTSEGIAPEEHYEETWLLFLASEMALLWSLCAGRCSVFSSVYGPDVKETIHRSLEESSRRNPSAPLPRCLCVDVVPTYCHLQQYFHSS